MTSHIRNTRWFTILELMVAIVIFTLGFIGAYMLIESANGVSVRSRDEVIGANILREQVELIKNLRDSNWIALRKWDSITNARDVSEADTTLRAWYYTIENGYDASRPVRVRKLSGFSGEKESILWAVRSGIPSMSLCHDSFGRYTHDCTGNARTPYASFLRIEPLETSDSAGARIVVGDAYRITAYFISTDRWYREYTMSTIVTDWKK